MSELVGRLNLYICQLFANLDPYETLSEISRCEKPSAANARTRAHSNALRTSRLLASARPQPCEVGGTGLEPVTPSLSSWC